MSARLKYQPDVGCRPGAQESLWIRGAVLSSIPISASVQTAVVANAMALYVRSGQCGLNEYPESDHAVREVFSISLKTRFRKLKLKSQPTYSVGTTSN